MSGQEATKSGGFADREGRPHQVPREQHCAAAGDRGKMQWGARAPKFRARSALSGVWPASRTARFGHEVKGKGGKGAVEVLPGMA